MEKMKVLLSGGTGFIGSHLAEELVTDGHEVLLYDVDYGNLGDLKELGLMYKLTFLQRDITEYGIIRDVIARWKPNQIVHLAGVSHTVASALGQRSALHPGVMGLATIQDAIRSCLEHREIERPPRVLIASSSLTSGMFRLNLTSDNRHTAVDNDATALDLKDCYHQYVDNKLAMEMLCHSNWAQHKLPFTIMRFGTQYGPRMNRNVVTWYFIRNALLGKPLEIHGDGMQRRQHFYVKDLVSAMMLILQNQARTLGRTISIVPEKMTTVNDLALIVAAATPTPVEIIHVDKRPIDVRVNQIRTSDLLEELGWSIEHSLRSGIEKTVEYYSNRMDLVTEGFDSRIKEEN